MKTKIFVTLSMCALGLSAFASCPTIQSGHGKTPGQYPVYTHITLPCAYPDTNYSVVITSTGGQAFFAANNKTNSGFDATPYYQQFSYNQTTFDWIAVQN